MPPKALIRHSMAGRTRLQVPERRRDTEYFERLVRGLAAIEGVQSIEANLLTGSVLFRHGEDLAAILEEAVRLGLFVLDLASPAAGEPLLARVHERLHSADHRILDATRGQLDLNGALLLALAAAGTLQILRGAVLPTGVNLLWYAFGLAWFRPARTS